MRCPLTAPHPACRPASSRFDGEKGQAATSVVRSPCVQVVSTCFCRKVAGYNQREARFNGFQASLSSALGGRSSSIFWRTTCRKIRTVSRYLRASAPFLTHFSSHSSVRKGMSQSCLTSTLRVCGFCSAVMVSIVAMKPTAATSSKIICLAWYMKPSPEKDFCISVPISLIFQHHSLMRRGCHVSKLEANPSIKTRNENVTGQTPRQHHPQSQGLRLNSSR